MKIFDMFGEVFIKDKASSQLNKIGDNFKKFGKGVLKAGKIVAGMTAATGVGLLVLANKTAAITDNIDKLSQQLGFSREAFQEWDFILSQNGVSIESLKSGMKTLTNQTADLADGGDIATDAFTKIGLSFDDLKGKTQEEIFELTVKGLQEMEDTTERAAVANDLLGRSGLELAPLLNSGAESVELLKEKAHDLNLIMSDEAVDAGVVFTDTMDATKRAMGAVVTEGISKLLPELSNLAQVGVEKFQIFIDKAIELKDKVIEWVEDNKPRINEIKENIKTFAENARTNISNFITKIIEIKDTVIEWVDDNKTRMDEIKAKFKESFDKIKEAMQPIIDLIADWIEKGKTWSEETDKTTGFLDILIGAVDFLADALTTVIGFLEDTVEWYKKNSTWIDAIVIATGAFVTILWLYNAATAAWTVITTAAAVAGRAFGAALKAINLPVFLIIAAIAALIAIGVLIWKNWDKISAFAKKIWGDISVWFENLLSGIGDFFVKMWEGIKKGVKAAWEFIKNIFFKFTPLRIIIKNFGAIKTWLKGLWDKIKTSLKKAWDFIKDIFLRFHPLGIIIKNFSKIITWFKTFGKKIKDKFKEIITNAKTWGKDFIQGFAAGIKAKVQAVVDSVKNIARKIKSFLGFSVPEKGALSDADEYGGDFMELYANKINASKNKLINAVKGVAGEIAITANPTKNDVLMGSDSANGRIPIGSKTRSNSPTIIINIENALGENLGEIVGRSLSRVLHTAGVEA